MNSSNMRLAVTIGIISIGTLTVHAGDPSHNWLNPVNGDWTDPGNWDNGTVPDMTNGVLLGLAGPYTVRSAGDISALNLTITNPHTTLSVDTSDTLKLFGDVFNDGVMTLNAIGDDAYLDIELDSTISGDGEILLNSSITDARIRTAMGVTLTQSATHSISGTGFVEASLINNGLIHANAQVGGISLRVNDKVNNGIIRSSNGNTLSITSNTISQGPVGIIEALGSGSAVSIWSSRIVGGILRTEPDGVIEARGVEFDGVTVTGGNIHQLSSSGIEISNSIRNDGTIKVNHLGNSGITQLIFRDSGAFDGGGEVILNSNREAAELRAVSGATVTNSEEHTIRGQGLITADLINYGLVSTDVPTSTMLLRECNIINNALIQAINISTLEFRSVTLDQTGGGLLFADGVGADINFFSTTVAGGVIRVTNNATFDIFDAELEGVTIEANARLLNSKTLDIRDGVVNNGSIVVNSNAGGSATQLQWLDESTLAGTGTVRLNSFDVRAWLTAANGVTLGTMGPGQRLEGIGRIGLPLELQGTHAPGLSVGTMLGTHPLTYTNSTTLEIEVNADSADLYDSSSTVALDGILEIRFVDGFAPTGFWARTIIEGSDITGKFDTVNIPDPAPGLVSKVINTGTKVLVGHTCPGDVNLDGLTNFFDVSTFLADFNNQTPAGDFNNDQQWNFFDVSAFLAAFTAGC